MKTAEEMYNYSLEMGYGSGMTKNWGNKHFKVIENNLGHDEEVYMTFIGLKDLKGMDHGGNYAYAITNKRIMFAQKRVVGETFKSVVFDRINDISSSKGMIFGTVTIHTLGEIFNVGVDRKTADKISKEIHRVILDIRSGKLGNGVDDIKENEVATLDTVLELRRYKELVDDGIISEEEFNQKKKELLG